MNIQLIQGQFNAKDAIDIITQMIYIKVNHLESKINNASNEEDIKFWETKIKVLQNELVEIKRTIGTVSGNISLKSAVEIQH